MTFSTDPVEVANFDVLDELVERYVGDEASLRGLLDRVRGATLDSDDRLDLEGRIGTYLADTESAKPDGGNLPSD